MTFWLLIPFLALVAIAQVTLLPLISIAGFKPDLALMVVVSWGMLAPIGEAAQWGFIVGIFLDLASGLPFGIHTLVLTSIGILVGLGQATFFHGNLVAPPIAMIASTLLHSILILGILAFFNWRIDWNDYLLRITLPTAILNTFAMPLVYFPLQQLQHRLLPQMEV
jgi:rod shape-determining protein MreD